MVGLAAGVAEGEGVGVGVAVDDAVGVGVRVGVDVGVGVEDLHAAIIVANTTTRTNVNP